MFGLLNANKPSGPTSHDIVAAIRRLVPPKVRVGHTGTLDPFANGVLVICLGQATRLAEYVQAQPKRYLADIALGATSTTDDPQGEIVLKVSTDPTAITAEPTRQAVEDVLAKFVGEIQQIPPAHSAVQVKGRRAYKLARAGEEVNLVARAVTIHTIALLEFDYPTVKLEIECGSGTYIRSLARDIGSALGIGGYCKALTRTAVGPFKLETAHTPQELDIARDLLPASLAVGNMSRITLSKADASRLLMGRRVSIDQATKRDATLTAVFNESCQLIAIATFLDNSRILKPVKVFSPPTR